jgi:hypothetical protein
MTQARRASKVIMFSQLEADLAQFGGAVGVDAASATFKSMPMFRTERYYGIDGDLSALELGRHQHPEATGLLADLTALDLPEASVDVCVSTNTIYQLAPEDRAQTVDRLARMIAPTGALIVQIERDDTFLGIVSVLRQRFERVDIMYFGNPLTVAYEAWLVRRHDLKARSQGIMATLTYNAARVLSFTEWMSKSALGRRYVYIRCVGRRDATVRNEFRFDESNQVSEGVFVIGERPRTAQEAHLRPHPRKAAPRSHGSTTGHPATR